MWINSTADIITIIFAKLWFNLITDIEYESRIKGGVNYFDIFLSDEKPYLTKFCDVILAFNKESLEKTIITLKNNWVVFCNSKISNTLWNDTKNFINKNNIKIISLDISDKYDNIYLLALFVYYFSIDIYIIKEALLDIFSRKWNSVIEANNKIFDNAISMFDFEKAKFVFTKKSNEVNLSYWNKMVSSWLIDSGLEYYSAYPMTPASSILTEIINSWKVIYHQAEDEIAVINSALWASFTWARSAVWTSWWWFALMTEALSFSIQAEIPITVIFSQRAWPSTWTPTYHETWDLNFALNPTFWDFEHIVLIPSSLEEAYYFAWISLNLADKYQLIVILLIDKQLSEMVWTIWKTQKIIIDRGQILFNPPEDYKRYEITDSWISPRVMVWTKNWDFISTSYEHDEYWSTSEDSENKKLMTEKRWRKLTNFFDKEWISWFELINENAKKIIVTFSATSYTAKKFIEDNSQFWLIIIKYLKPLDEKLLNLLINKEEIIFVENNYSWQLENYICNNFWLRFIKWLKISNLRKYDLYPFYIEDFNTLNNK